MCWQCLENKHKLSEKKGRITLRKSIFFAINIQISHYVSALTDWHHGGAS